MARQSTAPMKLVTLDRIGTGHKATFQLEFLRRGQSGLRRVGRITGDGRALCMAHLRDTADRTAFGALLDWLEEHPEMVAGVSARDVSDAVQEVRRTGFWTGATPRTEEPNRMELTVNGHSITAIDAGGGHFFDCPDYPQIAERFDGSSTTAVAIEEFMRLALAGAVSLTKLLTQKPLAS